MSQFVDVEAAGDGGSGDRLSVARGRARRGGARGGAGRPRGSRVNPAGDPVLNRQGKYWHFTVFYKEEEYMAVANS